MTKEMRDSHSMHNSNVEEAGVTAIVAPPKVSRKGGTLISVDCEAPFGVGSPSVGDMTEFGAVDVNALKEGIVLTFHGTDCSKETFEKFRDWLDFRRPVVFVSDNPAYDFQWINFYFWRYFNSNPFGHSGRRIGDFAAGLAEDFRQTQKWKRYRRTKHDHNPVNDAMGNAEALLKLFEVVKSDREFEYKQLMELR